MTGGVQATLIDDGPAVAVTEAGGPGSTGVGGVGGVTDVGVTEFDGDEGPDVVFALVAVAVKV